MKKFIKYLLIIFCFLIASSGNTQTIHVNLDKLTTLDDKGAHITLFKTKPDAKLQLPKIDITDANFFDLFYSWEVKDDPEIDVMIIQQKDHDVLYVDINNDENLENDGTPYIFKHTENSIHIDIVSNHDKNQITKLILLRKPELPDTILSVFVDNYGNLNEKLAKQYGIMNGDFNYKGEKGTFFFDDRVTLRRGIFEINRKSISVGLFDFTNNGLFNDDEDLLIIDKNDDGKLGILGNEYEVFKLNDVIKIQSNNYEINKIDKYGKWVDLVKTEKEATFYYLEEYKKMISDQAIKDGYEGEIDQSFWELNFITLKNEKIEFINLKGKFILLNFWGEWCKPCISEIPDLIEISDKYPRMQLQLISFLKSSNLEKAKNLIKENNINWPQILLSDVIESYFKIMGYPTNILIFPDGKQYIQTGQINLEFVINSLKKN